MAYATSALARSRDPMQELMGGTSTVVRFGSRALLSLFMAAAPHPECLEGAVTTEEEPLELIQRNRPTVLFARGPAPGGLPGFGAGGHRPQTAGPILRPFLLSPLFWPQLRGFSKGLGLFARATHQRESRQNQHLRSGRDARSSSIASSLCLCDADPQPWRGKGH